MGYRNPFGALTYKGGAQLAAERYDAEHAGAQHTDGRNILLDEQRDRLAAERAERNRIARECAEVTQERDRLRELANRMRPVVRAAVTHDSVDELADVPGGSMDRELCETVEDAHQVLREAVADWHVAVAADRAEGRAPLIEGAL